MQNLGEFGELQVFSPIFTISITFPMQMDFNSPKFFLPNFLQSLFTKIFTAKDFYCIVWFILSLNKQCAPIFSHRPIMRHWSLDSEWSPFLKMGVTGAYFHLVGIILCLYKVRFRAELVMEQFLCNCTPLDLLISVCVFYQAHLLCKV